VFIDVDQTVDQVFDLDIVSSTQFGQGSGLKTAIVIDGGIGVLIDFVKELMSDLGFVI
jgi:hypothetical protein